MENKKYFKHWKSIIQNQFNTDTCIIMDNELSIHNVLDIKKQNTFKSVNMPNNLQMVRNNSEKIIYKKIKNIYGLHYKKIDIIKTIYLVFKYIQNKWILVCNYEERRVGLCNNPIQDFIGLTIKEIIDMPMYKVFNCIPIHINLEFIYSDILRLNHANTLLIFKSTGHGYLYEPYGKLNNIFFEYSSLPELELETIFRNIFSKLKLRYIGYLTPQFNFQLDNDSYCFLWTTWVELILLINPLIQEKKVINFFRKKYYNIISETTTRMFILDFSKYLNSLL
jgi:hypothetical protein